MDGSTPMKDGMVNSPVVPGHWRPWKDPGKSSGTPSSGSPICWWRSWLENSNLGKLAASECSSFTQTISTSASSCLIFSDGAPKVMEVAVWDGSSVTMGVERTLVSAMSVCSASGEVKGFGPHIGSLVSDRSSWLSTSCPLELPIETILVTFILYDLKHYMHHNEHYIKNFNCGNSDS